MMLVLCFGSLLISLQIEQYSQTAAPIQDFPKSKNPVCPFLQSFSIILSIKSLSFAPRLFLVHPYATYCTGSKLYICKYSYTLLDNIPIISFHVCGRHEMSRLLSAVLLCPGSFWQSVVFPTAIHIGNVRPVVNHIINLCWHSFM